ncbi:glycine cleavage system aminomethyltransferase GcvT [Cryobacterium sp. PH31-O1]|uniref:glycine cleavage system aminomethyltransferase GcvT n=1 Tax=Cryobacterium sp. PH31-O1 TaxID=3046306 RepID=UPI0024BA0F77|nr:glycine cleavage system aminomethyltransferase GcvT [Cryobacterium sp. PH31-O1]MDJ0339276.1 glycine cleavage system aminomethyltransferase GcvT [Cryobacterium sp. PH31-O1]
MTSADSSTPASSSERFSPLHQAHVDSGASFTDFAGWQMPVRYSSDLAEHHAVRNQAGLFDLSHMAEILVDGPDAAAYLDYALAGKLSVIELWQAKYSLLLNENGGIIDDLVVYRLDDAKFLIVANAGNRFAAFDALLARAAAFDVAVVDQSDDYALIAVQGPNALAILDATAGVTELGTDLHFMKYYRITDAVFRGHPLLVARTGYTGEDGFELYLAADQARELWDALMSAGAEHGLVPAGLASRDTLRLEAGMPLYGHELTLTTFPAQAGLGKVVNLGKENDFVGRAASVAGPAAGASVLVGLIAAGKRAGRADYAIFRSLDAETADGVITSGALSPSLGYPIAMAYVAPDLARLGTEVYVDVRGTRLPATVTSLPFYKRVK